MDGLLVIDKPAGPTSHDVVARMRRILGERRIGHTGTLDPAASGVLPLVIGRATRLAQFLTSSDKEYDAVVRLGTRTTTCDAEGDPIGEPWRGQLPTPDAIERALDAFRGGFEQQPPAFSAKKVNGVRSYRIARSRAHVAPAAPVAPLAPVVVTVHRLDLLAVEADCVTLRVSCSAGFYVRALAHDLGERLGTGAHLATLRRIRSGDYGLDGALTLEAAEHDASLARQSVIPPERLLTGWPAVVLTGEGAKRAAHGRDLGRGDAESALPPGPRVRLLDHAGRLVGIAEATGGGFLHPAVVFV